MVFNRFLFLFMLFPVAVAAQDRTKLFSYFGQANAASRSKDFAQAKRFLDTALMISPDFSEIIYAHARMSVRSGDINEAMDDIEKMIRHRSVKVLTIQTDSTFKPLEKNERFLQLLRDLDVFQKAVSNSTVAFTIPETDLVPEGTAYDRLKEKLYISSVYKRKVISIDRQGKVEDFIPTASDGVLGVLGMEVDVQRRLLWFCSSYSPLNEIIDWKSGSDSATAIYKYDIDSKKLIKKYRLRESQGRFFNDLTVSPAGDVFITDSEGNEVFWIDRSADTIASFIPQFHLYSPNGITIDQQRQTVYIAGYLGGIMKVNLKDKSIHMLGTPPDIPLAGTDGMAYYNNSLIINSPVEHKAVLRLYLDTDGNNVIKREFIEYKSPFFGETTTGELSGKTFYYIANSGLDAYQGGKLQKEKLKPPVILKTELK